MGMKLTVWRKCIEEARQRGFFNMQELSRAYNWATCAVGERKGFVDAPRTRAEDKLGGLFYACAIESDFDGALRVLEALESI